MITPELVRYEIEKLTIVLNDNIERTKDELNSKTKLIMNLLDIGFVKISQSKYNLDIQNRGKSYISFTITFRGKAVDIYEDHLVIKDGKEIPSSEIIDPFNLVSVRYSRVMGEVYNRASFLVTEFSKGKE